jgi:N-methylhydantoinase A/oxoprolinase/acetone carboxylase beta subunit
LGVKIGGIDTNFRMPDLVSIAVGGGSIIRQVNGQTVIGPDSVGYRLPQEALIFGGSQATLSDATVSAGRGRFGTHDLDPSVRDHLAAGLEAADRAVADAVDRVKVARGDMPLIAVGGGSVLLSNKIPGVSEVYRPDNYDVANAIGAAIGTVSGQVDRIFALGNSSRADIIAEAVEQATQRAVRAGADPKHVEVVGLEEIPLAYLTNPALRIKVKAAGPLGSL